MGSRSLLSTRNDAVVSLFACIVGVQSGIKLSFIGQTEKRMKTQGELEAAVSQTIIRFEKEYMGRGPLETKSMLLDDMLLVRLKGVLTPTEIKLAESQERGRYLLKQVRQQLLDFGRPLLESAIEEILGVPVESVYTDISTRTGERIIVFTLAAKPSFKGQSSSS